MKSIEERIKLLSDFFGRKPDFKMESFNNYAPKTQTLRFPATEKEVLFNSKIINLTIGMSDEIEDGDGFQKIELSAITHKAYQEEPESDFITSIVNWMANFSYKNKVIYEQGEIFEWGNPFINDCVLENLYFSYFPFGEDYSDKYDALLEILDVDEIINFIPISNKEKKLYDKKGVLELIKVFEKNDMSPDFHFHRKSFV